MVGAKLAARISMIWLLCQRRKQQQSLLQEVAGVTTPPDETAQEAEQLPPGETAQEEEQLPPDETAQEEEQLPPDEVVVKPGGPAKLKLLSLEGTLQLGGTLPNKWCCTLSSKMLGGVVHDAEKLKALRVKWTCNLYLTRVEREHAWLGVLQDLIVQDHARGLIVHFELNGEQRVCTAGAMLRFLAFHRPQRRIY